MSVQLTIRGHGLTGAGAERGPWVQESLDTSKATTHPRSSGVCRTICPRPRRDDLTAPLSGSLLVLPAVGKMISERSARLDHYRQLPAKESLKCGLVRRFEGRDLPFPIPRTQLSSWPPAVPPEVRRSVEGRTLTKPEWSWIMLTQHVAARRVADAQPNETRTGRHFGLHRAAEQRQNCEGPRSMSHCL